MAPRSKTARITIRTVAEDAGVSPAAVSKVLRDAYGVSPGLRAKVQASIAKLGYRPHAAARGMRGQTYTLGIILSDIQNPFFSDIMSGIHSAIERTQYQPLLGVSKSSVNIELTLVDAMIDRQMDGIILVAPAMSAEKIHDVAERIPTVLIGHHDPSETAFDTVNNNDLLGGRIAVQHLVAQGYKNISFLSLDLPHLADLRVTVQMQRETGYRQAMAEANLTRFASVLRAPQTPRESQTAARQLLQSGPHPHAIFCWTDFIALEVLSAARELNLSVPEQVAVVGYDNVSYCDLAQNSLTSIDQSGQVLGLQAVRLLVERIKGRETAEHFVVTPRLVARGSSMASRVKGRSAAG
jgi:LacI family transcriptional regulator